MANDIQLKRSSVAGRVPVAANVLVGEPVINLNDKIIFTRDTSNNIIVIGAGTTANVIENGNLYFSNARVSSAISSQTLGNATFSSVVSTGNISAGNAVVTNALTAGTLQTAGNVNASSLRVVTNSTLGTVVSGTWNGSSISTTYTDAKVTSVNGQTGAATGFATTANTLAQFGATTSAQLLGVISDETGTGSLVFANSPTLATAIATAVGSNTSAAFKVTDTLNRSINFLANVGGGSYTPLATTNDSLIFYTAGLTGSGNLVISPWTTSSVGVKIDSIGNVIYLYGNVITSGGIELGNASDTTIARSAAGVITVEGIEVVTLSRTQTLTNKTLTSPTLTTPALGLATGTSVMLSANIGAAAGNVSGNFTAGNFQTTGAINAASGTISSATGRIIFGTDAGGSISLGNVSNLGASTPYLDFNSGATTVDYDSRITGSGGNGVSGNGTLTFTSATAAFTGNVTAVNSNFTGNVGFGVSTVPAGSRVAVAGTIGVSETGGTGGRLQITSTGSGAVIFQNDNSPIIFKTLSGTQEKMRIVDTGNVEITGNLTVSSGVSRLGTITSGTWNGSSISTTYTDAKVTSVNGQTGAATGFATTANSLSQFASTTSAQLATLISDETGTGSLVFAASPVLSGTLSVGGTANIMSSVSNTTAQIKVSPASGASNANSKINFQGTFFNYPADTGARLAATIKSGFSTGAWGTEYLDILVNNANNDISSEANQNRIARFTKGNVDVTGNIITSGSIELGNASDTTIARSAAGVITVEGVEVVTLSRTQTLTNKTLTSPTLTAPVLGTPSSGTLTSCTGLPLTTGVTGTLPVANGGTGITSLAAGVATFLGTPSSANLATAVTDETGSGALVFATLPTFGSTGVKFNGSTSGTTTVLATATAGTTTLTLPAATDTLVGKATTDTLTNKTLTSPTLTAPVLGTPASGTLTNCTFPTLNQNTTGSAANATNATNSAITNDIVTNASFFPTFVSANTGNRPQTVSSTKLFFNPSTGLLTSTDYNSSSDKRLKKNIKTVDSALDKVIALRGVSFDWKEGGAKAIGLIAQEVEKVIPEIVSQDESGYLGIKYNNLIGVLVEAIKEQQEQINTLKKLIEKQ